MNSVVFEQKNFWLGLYKHSQKTMKFYKYNFISFILCDEFNDFNLRGSMGQLKPEKWDYLER